jgi:hypothetical protein
MRIGAVSCTQLWYQPGNVECLGGEEGFAAWGECFPGFKPERFGRISLFPSFLGEFAMLAKMTVKNQLTLPKAVATQFRGVEYFDVSTDGSAITLKPLRPSRLDEVRAKLEQLGITEQDVTDAIAWARQSE